MINPTPVDSSESELFDKPDSSDSPWWPEEDMPGAEGEPWKEVENFPRGKYFIGDPCHVFAEYYSYAPEGIATDIDGIGRVFWVGVDNLYGSTDEESDYVYDSMAVGIFPVDHLDPDDWASLKKCGRLIEWQNGGVLEDEDEDDWEGATCVGIDFLGNVYLGNDWWLTYDFLESELLPSSLSHLKSDDG
jgi:hypothetical protein